MTCWFCERAEAEDKKSVRLHMVGEIQSSQVQKNKKWLEYVTQVIDVPRCADCKRKHKKAAFYSEMSIFMFVVMLAAGISAYTTSPDWIWGIALGLGAGLFVLFRTVRSIALKGIKKKSAANKKYPEVANLLRKGYKFGKIPSYKDSTKAQDKPLEESIITEKDS